MQKSTQKRLYPLTSHPQCYKTVKYTSMHFEKQTLNQLKVIMPFKHPYPPHKSTLYSKTSKYIPILNYPLNRPQIPLKTFP